MKNEYDHHKWHSTYTYNPWVRKYLFFAPNLYPSLGWYNGYNGQGRDGFDAGDINDVDECDNYDDGDGELC